MRFGLFVAALSLCAATSAWAQSTDQSAAPAAPAAGAQSSDQAQRFQGYVTNDGYKQMIGQLAVMGDSISFPDCKNRKPVSRTDMIIFVPPVFGDALHPTSGLWKDQIKMDHCGGTGYQNVLINAQDNGQPPRVALMMPGLTSANPWLQDLIMQDFLAALSTKSKCSDQTKILPLDTKMDKETKPRQLNAQGMMVAGEWKEIWTFRACDKEIKATIELQADGKGGMSHKVKL